MTHDEAVNILKEHQLWRKGIPPYDKAGAFPYYTPQDLSAALDYAIAELDAWQGVALYVENMEAQTNDNTH